MAQLRNLFGWNKSTNTQKPILVDVDGRLKQSHGQPDPVPVDLSAVGAQAALLMDGFSTFSVYYSGTFAGVTLVVEQSADSTDGINGTWAATMVVNASNSATVTSTPLNAAATSTAAWNGSAPGANYMRVRMTARTSGTLSVKLVASTASTPATVNVAGTVTAAVSNGTMIPSGSAGAAGSSVFKVLSAATTNAGVVKAGAGRIYGYHISNSSASWRYIRLYNQVAAPTVGTTVPIMVIPIGPGQTITSDKSIPITFATGIAISITGAAADLDATAIVANEVVGHILFL